MGMGHRALSIGKIKLAAGNRQLFQLGTRD